MKLDLIKDFNLPAYIKGKSFADASKAIESKFSDRTDVASKETKEELMGRLAKAQEHVKMQEALKANSQEIPDMMGGQVPEGFEEFAMGGRLPIQGINTLQPAGLKMDNPLDQIQAGDTSGLTAPGVDAVSATPSLGGAMGMASTGLELGMQAFGDTGVDTSGLAGRQEKGDVAMGALGSAAKGAQAGMALGPWGAAAGAVIGGAAGLIGGSKANKDIQKANKNTSLVENNQHRNTFAFGGPIDPKKKMYPQNPDEPIDRPSAAYDKMVTSSGIMSFPYAGGIHPKPSVSTGEPVNRDINLVFDNQFNSPAREATVVDKGTSSGAPVNREIRGIFDNQYDQVARVPDPIKKPFGPQHPDSLSIFERAPHDGTMPATTATSKGKGTSKATVAPREVATSVGSVIPEMGIKADNVGTFVAPKLKQTKKFTGEVPEQDKLGTMYHDTSEWLKRNGGDVARFAGVANDALQLASLKKKDRESLDRVDTRYKTDYVDEKSLENRVQNEGNNVSRALAGASNGSMGALRANLLGASLNKTNATSDAFLKADDINRQEDRAAQQFNSRNDMINLQQSNREKENAARDDAAFETSKSALRAGMAGDIGNIGKEMGDKKTIAKMFGYDVQGDYVVGKDGKRKTWRAFQEELKAYKKNGNSK